MGKLTPIYLALMATFMLTALAGCALEIASGSISFVSDDEPVPPSDGQTDGESPSSG